MVGLPVSEAPQGRPAQIMRALAAHPEGLSTPQLVEILAEGVRPQQRILTWYGGILRLHCKAGHVERAGFTRGAWQRGPAMMWRITPAGVRWLRDTEEKALRPSYQERQAQARAEREARRQQATAALERARPAAATTRSERARIARELRDAGCSLAQIGAALGVSGEMARLDLMPDGEYEALLEAKRAAYKPSRKSQSRRGGRPSNRARVAEEIARAIERSVCGPGEQCPDRWCPDCVGFEQARKDAATARRIGGAG